MINLNETEADFFRDTLTILIAVHSRGSDPGVIQSALDILKADGAMDADGAQAIILGRVLKMAEKFL